MDIYSERKIKIIIIQNDGIFEIGRIFTRVKKMQTCSS